jgi:serine/threonine-protein kinase
MASKSVRSPATRGRSRIATVLLPLLALLAGAGIAAALLQALADPQPASSAAAAEQRENGSIVLDADDYIGRPVGEVAERLTALGLDVELREEITEDTVPDRVIGVQPSGTSLEPGDRVIVTYAVAPAETSRDRTSGGSGVTGAAVGEEAAPTEGPAQEDAVPTGAARTEAPAPTTMSATATSGAPSETTSSSASDTTSSAATSTSTQTTTETSASSPTP